MLDAKADYLLYGMADISALEFADALKNRLDPRSIRGLCYLVNTSEADQIPAGYIELPTFEKVKEDPHAFIEMFHTFYKNNDPLTARGLYQRHGTRYVIQNPPARIPTQVELDAIYALDYQRAQHPYYEMQGKVKALDTIQFSINTHHGCYGECNFCAIGVHQGRTIRTRSEESILDEAKQFTEYKDFKGIISDVGGPTANMYGYECSKKLKHGTCDHQRCVDDTHLCKKMKVDHTRVINLLRRLREVRGIKKAFVASGVRYDLINEDKRQGYEYLKEMVRHHISGQMKVAPEHTSPHVLHLMNKPGKQTLVDFKKLYERLNREEGKNQFLTYYLIAAHPGCTEKDMHDLKRFTTQELKMNPEQAQVFTPTPGTYSAVMYYTEMDPQTRQKIFVEKDTTRKEKQKQIVVAKDTFKSGFAS